MRYMAIRACYYSDGVYAHKYFKEGEMLPEEWKPNENGCTHFAPVNEAKKIIKTGSAKKRALTAGDDVRSTDELKAELKKYLKLIPRTWKRKKIWSELIKKENAVAQDAQTASKQSTPKKEK